MANFNTGPMWLIYRDSGGKLKSQPWGDLEEVGPLIDPDTGDDLDLVGWSTEEV